MTSNKQSENIIEGRPQRGSNIFRMPLKEGERKLGRGWKYEGNDKEEKGDMGNWRAERGMKETEGGPQQGGTVFQLVWNTKLN